MFELLTDPGFWASLFSVSLIQVALSADNLIIVTIIANKLPESERDKAIRWGLILAMLFRIALLGVVSYVLKFATTPLFEIETALLGLVSLSGSVSGKSLLLAIGGLVLIWKGIKELRIKIKGVEQEVKQANKFVEVVAVIVAMNLLFSVDSILTVVGMTDTFAVMVGSVVISVALMLYFAKPIADFITRNPDFEILGLFVLLLIGFVLFLEGGHDAHLMVGMSQFPFIPQWIVIFILLLMFSVDFYQNWWEKRQEHHPLALHRRKK